MMQRPMKLRYPAENGRYTVRARCLCGISRGLVVPRGESQHECAECHAVIDCRVDIIDGDAFFQMERYPTVEASAAAYFAEKR